MERCDIVGQHVAEMVGRVFDRISNLEGPEGDDMDRTVDEQVLSLMDAIQCGCSAQAVWR